MKKTPIKEFASAAVENAIRMRLKLIDSSSSIELAAFHQDCDALDKLELNNWYFLSNAGLILAQKKFKEWPKERAGE